MELKMALHLNHSVRKVLADFADKNFHRGSATRKSLDFISSIVQSSINSALFNNIWHTQNISSQGCLLFRKKFSCHLYTSNSATNLTPSSSTLHCQRRTGTGWLCDGESPFPGLYHSESSRRTLRGCVLRFALLTLQHKPRELLELGLLSHTKYSIQKLSRK